LHIDASPAEDDLRSSENGLGWRKRNGGKNSTEILQKIGKKKLLDTLDCAVALYLASTLPLDQAGDVFNYTGVTVRRRLRELELAGIASREWKNIKKTVLKS
jgi:hypothetical protein